MKKLKKIKLSDKVVVSDPCYTKDVWCMIFLNTVLEGLYTPIIKYESDLKNYKVNEDHARVASLEVIHDSISDYTKLKWKLKSGTVGVDSGQAGIFCNSIYPDSLESTGEYGDDNTFYGQCCNATLGKSYNERSLCFAVKRLVDRYKNNDEFYEGYLETIDEVYGKDSITYKYYKDKITIPTLEYIQGDTVKDKGVVTSSGYGDGSYNCYTASQNGLIVGIKIIYIK